MIFFLYLDRSGVTGSAAQSGLGQDRSEASRVLAHSLDTSE
jgi:hypothetical protein